MAEINAAASVITIPKGPAREELTQSLDQLVKKKLKEAVKGIKKKMDELPSQGGVQHPLLVTEHLVQQPMLRLKVLNAVNVGHQYADLPKRGEGSETSKFNNLTALSASQSPRTVGQKESTKSHTPTVNHRDIELPPRAHEVTNNRQHALNKGGEENVQVTEPRPLVERLQWVAPEDNLSDRSVDENTRSDLDKTAFLVTAGEHLRVNLGDKGQRNGNSTTVETSLHQQRPEFQSGKMMELAPAEKAEGSKLTYRFSDWGGGHQVNVQLGTQHRTPHVLQPSDTLVYQRLAEYDGQPQGDWVFSDDQEPSGHRRQQPDEEAE